MTFEKPKSKLFRPDPYYIPGYCGYCPMQKYQLGETYGKTTANILTDPTVSIFQKLYYISIQQAWAGIKKVKKRVNKTVKSNFTCKNTG